MTNSKIHTSLHAVSTPDYSTIISHADAKRQVWHNASNYDTDLELIIERLIAMAVQSCENYTWMGLAETEYEYRMDQFPDGIIHLPRSPIKEFDKIEYVTGDGTQLLDPSEYRVDKFSMPARLEPVYNWPNTKDQINAVTITFTSGFTNNVPADLLDGMLALINHAYDNRGLAIIGRGLSVSELPIGIKHKWGPHSLRNFG